jgi:hypothetical protein
MRVKDLGIDAVDILLMQPLRRWATAFRTEADRTVMPNGSYKSGGRHRRTIFDHERFVAVTERDSAGRPIPPSLGNERHPPVGR